MLEKFKKVWIDDPLIIIAPIPFFLSYTVSLVLFTKVVLISTAIVFAGFSVLAFVAWCGEMLNRFS